MFWRRVAISHGLRWEYFRAIYTRYGGADRKLKVVILDEFCANTGYHRKYALRLLNGPPPERVRRSRRRPPSQGRHAKSSGGDQTLFCERIALRRRAIVRGLEVRKGGELLFAANAPVEIRRVEFTGDQVQYEIRARVPVKLRVRNNPPREFPAGLSRS